MKSRHAYVCECKRRRCRERIHMPSDLYDEVRSLGSIVSAACARRDDRIVVRDYRTFAVCLTSNGGRAVVVR